MTATLMKTDVTKTNMSKAAVIKPQLLGVFLALTLSACTSLQPHEKAANAQAKQAGLVDIKQSNFDVFYGLPTAKFSQYKKVILNDLDMSNVKISRSSMDSIHETPWELTNDDKAFYQQKYREAAEEYIFAKGVLAVADKPASDTLVLKMKLVEIAPLGSKDDLKGRPQKVEVYTRGFGRMIAVYELYDSLNNQLLAMASDEQELGFMWEKNDRVQTNMRINLAFERWFKKLGDEVTLLSKK